MQSLSSCHTVSSDSSVSSNSYHRSLNPGSLPRTLTMQHQRTEDDLDFEGLSSTSSSDSDTVEGTQRIRTGRQRESNEEESNTALVVGPPTRIQARVLRGGIFYYTIHTYKHSPIL